MSYLVLTPDSDPVATFDTPRDVVAALKTGRGLEGLGAVNPRRVVWFDNANPFGGGAELGAAEKKPRKQQPAGSTVAAAFEASRLPILRELPSMTLTEAWKLVGPYLPTTKYRRKDDTVIPVKANTASTYFTRGLLNQNAKTAKVLEGDLDAVRAKLTKKGKAPDERDVAHFYRKMREYQRAITARGAPGGTAFVKGLSLLPHRMAYAGPGNKFVEKIRPNFLPLYGIHKGINRGKALEQEANLCHGASQECRESCLVFSGHNTSDDYNVARKYALTQALLNEPEAFAVLLNESIRLFTGAKNPNGILRMVRLNVLSDVPWEVVMPWIFDTYPDVQFYDYTKVGGRETPANYDLTWSYSGVNDAQTEVEFALGRRVAVVVGAIRESDKKVIRPMPRDLEGARYRHREGMPWWPMIDGESSDTRPLDPGGVVVGLPWKAPKVGKQVEVGAFVVRGKYKGDLFVAEQIPRATTDVSAPPDEDDDERQAAED